MQRILVYFEVTHILLYKTHKFIHGLLVQKDITRHAVKWNLAIRFVLKYFCILIGRLNRTSAPEKIELSNYPKDLRTCGNWLTS